MNDSNADLAPAASSQIRLPAVRCGPDGRRDVDYRAVFRLAGPLFFNSALQAVLSLTDTWFIGRLSVAATAAMGASFFLVLVFVLLFGGVGLAVQTVAAQAYGAGDDRRAARVVWTGLYGTLCVAPLFIAVARLGESIFAPFNLSPEVAHLALEYWQPRLIGCVFGVGFWAIAGFFNGIGRPTVTLALTALVATVNAILNELFMFRLGWGIAGSAWATSCALFAGLAVAFWLFLSAPLRERFECLHGWRVDLRSLGRLFALGIPMGMFACVDLLGWALFQLMLTRLGPVPGAATQIVVMLTSVAFYPALGLAMAGTTLVGQSIGAGDKAWAFRLGNTIIAIAVGYMGVTGVVLALLGPWLVPLFSASSDPNVAEVVRLGTTLLWIATCYQIFDALNLGASFCLRGAGDVRAPTIALIGLAWFGFVPLTHMMTFASGQGWVDWLPHLGYGAVGAWIAAVIYVVLLGLLLFARWRSGAWQRLRVH